MLLERDANAGAQGGRDPYQGAELHVLGAAALDLRDQRLLNAEPLGELSLREAARFPERDQILSRVDLRQQRLDLVLVRGILRALLAQSIAVPPFAPSRVGFVAMSVLPPTLARWDSSSVVLMATCRQAAR